jgi:hypothetical protein
MKEQLTIISDDLNHGIITEEEARTKLLILFGVSGSLLKSLHQDLKGFQEMGFLTPDAKSGLGIAIEQVERYMRGDLEARQQ